MNRHSFVARAAARRPASVGLGIAGLVAAAIVLWIDSAFIGPFIDRLSEFDMGTEVYRRAQWASTTALVSFVAAASSLGTWLVGASLRNLFGLPARQTPEWLGKLLPLRVVGSVAVLLWLGVWASDEIFLRYVDWATTGSLVLGLLITANFAWDVPRLFLDGRAALAARLPILRVPLVPIGALPSTGRVRVRGRIAGAFGPALEQREDGPRALVYERRLPAFDAVDERVRSVPFLVESEGAQAIIDSGTSTPIVEAGAQSEQHDARLYTCLRAGDQVEVLGEVVSGGGGGDAYRDGPARIGVSDGSEPLLVFASADSMHRRLVIAGAVEMLCAAALGACVLGLVAAWLGLRLIAHPELHKL